MDNKESRFQLPQRTIIVIDRNDSVRATLCRELSEWAPGVAVQEFSAAQSAEAWMRAQEQAATVEPLLVVSDRVGKAVLELVGAKGTLFPWAKKIGHTGADPGIMTEWKSRGIVDDYAPKGPLAPLHEKVADQLNAYRRDSVLADMRDYIENRCDVPEVPYYPADDYEYLNILEVYREVVRGTPLGREAARSWAETRALLCGSTEGTVAGVP